MEALIVLAIFAVIIVFIYAAWATAAYRYGAGLKLQFRLPKTNVPLSPLAWINYWEAKGKASRDGA